MASLGNSIPNPPWSGSPYIRTPPSLISSSPYIQEILCRNCRRRGDLPDLIASLPPSADAVRRSNAIDIPGSVGRRRMTVATSAPASPESIGQELRRIADDFDLNYRASAGRTTPCLNTAPRSRSLSFLG